MKVAVLGGGRWGTAMALYVNALNFQTTLFFHSEQSHQFAQTHRYSKRLTQFPIPEAINLTSNLNSALEDAKYVIVSIPVIFLRSFLEQHSQRFNPSIEAIIGINKGIEANSLKSPYDIFQEFLPRIPYAQLGGPCFPDGLIKKENPAAESLSASDENSAKEIQRLFSTPSFRIYINHDSPSTIALLGAIKNVYAIAAGIISSLELSEESYAILVTRGIAEIKRLFKAMDLSEQSIYGLSGLGDLMLSCYSQKLSQNKLFGSFIGQGLSIDQAIEKMDGKECEGYFTCRAVSQLMEQYQVEMPIANAIFQVLYQGASAKDALALLMKREPKFENESER